MGCGDLENKIICSGMSGSRKYPYPYHKGSLEILMGRGVLKAKIFKGKYEPKLEFSEGWAFKPERPSVGEYGYFLEQHNLKKQCETKLV